MDRSAFLPLIIATIISSGAWRPVSLPPQSQPHGTHNPRAEAFSDDDVPCPQQRAQTAETRFGEYVIRTYRWPNVEGCIQILRSGKVVYSLVSGDFEIAETFDYGDRIPVGTDITGSGKPEAVVSEWSGGAHCCYTYHVFQLADHFREIARLDLGDAEAEFIDLDHGGSYEVETVDYDFGYWRTGFTESPAPRIVLRFTRGRYRLAPDLMKTPAPEPSEFEKLVDLVSSDNDWSSVVPKDCEQDCGIPVALWKNMLDLMYEGHTDLAWRLFDESWPDDRNDKKDFASQFCRRLRDSYYWPSLEKSIGPCPRK